MDIAAKWQNVATNRHEYCGLEAASAFETVRLPSALFHAPYTFTFSTSRHVRPMLTAEVADVLDEGPDLSVC